MVHGEQDLRLHKPLIVIEPLVAGCGASTQSASCRERGSLHRSGSDRSARAYERAARRGHDTS